VEEGITVMTVHVFVESMLMCLVGADAGGIGWYLGAHDSDSNGFHDDSESVDHPAGVASICASPVPRLARVFFVSSRLLLADQHCVKSSARFT
jgi:hypothetical protein